MRGSRAVTVAITLFLLLLVNGPLVRSAWDGWRLDRDGREVSVTVTDHAVSQGAYVLRIEDERLEPGGRPLLVRVDQATYDDAVAAGSVPARVLPGDPPRFEVAGQVTSRVSLVVTLAVDLVVVAFLVLYLRFRVALRPELVLRATHDLEPCEPGSVLDRVMGNEYVVAGLVVEVGRGEDGDAVVLDLGDRRVRVLLDGHANPVPAEQPARVVGVMIA